MSDQLRPAPAFALTHLTGRPVALSDYKGRPIVLVVGGRNSADEAGRIGRAVAARYTPDRLLVVAVLHILGVPRLMRGVAKTQIKKMYDETVREAAATLAAAGATLPADPSQVVVWLPDWDGAVARAYGLGDVDRQAVAVLIDAGGTIRGTASGVGAGDRIVTLAAALTPPL